MGFKMYSGTKIYDVKEITEKNDKSMVLVETEHLHSLMDKCDTRERENKELKHQVERLQKRLDENDEWRINNSRLNDILFLLQGLHKQYYLDKNAVIKINRLLDRSPDTPLGERK